MDNVSLESMCYRDTHEKHPPLFEEVTPRLTCQLAWTTTPLAGTYRLADPARLNPDVKSLRRS